MKFIDIHCHLEQADFDLDRSAVLERAKAADVGMITIGTDFKSSREAVTFAASNPNIWASIGLHPTDAPDAEFDYGSFKELAMNQRVVAIGECGLDYFQIGSSDRGDKDQNISATNKSIEIQRAKFIEQIKLANEVGKPLMLHVREAKRANRTGKVQAATPENRPSVYLETVNLLKQYAKVPANFHFFAGTIEDAKAIMEIGGMMSFTGVITFAREYDEVIKYVPIERIMSETDCPWVAPLPYRGKRNEPTYVTEVVKAIARIKGISEQKTAEILLENARRFFRLDL